MNNTARLLTLLFPALVAGPLAAQTVYPTKPVRLVLPVTPGGLQDNLARTLAPELGRRWGQPILVENRTGANGAIATQFVARAPADGYTLLMASSMQASNDLNPDIKGAPDPTHELAPIIAPVATGNILVTTPQFPANTLRELLDLARSNPGKFNYGSFGVASSSHLDMQALADMYGIQATHIPYQGGADLMQALLGGQIAFTISGLQSALPFVKQGRLKAIAYGGMQRSALLPEVPTLSESGAKGFESGGWFGWFAPAATPRPVIDRIAADVAALITTPEVRDKYITGVGFDVLNLTGPAFAEKFRADRELYAARLKKLRVGSF
ncbi:MAG: tripartite tricarboxylate transporter substrate binding protein [Burkholderiales bacterium]|nr:tripartite tricarboxylate transporter substrate binding protein [Burkholderiales bacterium]